MTSRPITAEEGGDRTPASLRQRLLTKFSQPAEDVRLLAEVCLQKRRVYRQTWGVGDQMKRVVVKRFSVERGCIERLAIERWLPAVGLGLVAPWLLDVLPDLAKETVWHVYEDLGDRTLDFAEYGSSRTCKARDRGFLSPMQGLINAEQLEAVLKVAAKLHDAFANHAVLGECRYWAGDLGANFLRTSVRDATRALEGVRAPGVRLEQTQVRVLDELLEQLFRLRDEEERRCAQLEALGGTETLLHGDLGVRNVLVSPSRAGWTARLIDWDHAGVGPVGYDLSNFLAQIPAAQRKEALQQYRELRRTGGAKWPSDAEWNGLFDTAERSRLANSVIWPALSALEGDVESAVGELAEISSWLKALQPVLPSGTSVLGSGISAEHGS